MIVPTDDGYHDVSAYSGMQLIWYACYVNKEQLALISTITTLLNTISRQEARYSRQVDPVNQRSDLSSPVLVIDSKTVSY
ncbi:hypothetical protein D915_009536 [Fasciola hepatica]|uniref:Uncharacterized protein n=1 Tax=Fasciola hepatica TaxID=6192 RepID=A0A4E0QWN3_FASHE|nr:hypothetical protein D915_009536 [Fasciola hepatica]